MKDEQKTREQLIEERNELRGRLERLEHLEHEHEELAKTLVESNRKLSMMIEHLPGMGYSCKNDEHWTMTFVSSGCEELTGYKPEELLDNAKVSYNQIIHPGDRDYVREHVEEALDNKQPWRLLYRIQTAQGDEKWVWERGVGVFSEDGQVITLLGYIINQAG
jgi:PAS domain S-box-containing protein